MANPAINPLSFLNSNVSDSASSQAGSNKQRPSTSFSDMLQSQVGNRSTQQSPANRLEQSPQKDNAVASRPQQRPASPPEKTPATPKPEKPAENKPAENNSANGEKPVENTDNSSNNAAGQNDQNSDTSAENPADQVNPPVDETADTATPVNPLMIATVTVPQDMQPASLAAMVSQIAERLARPAGDGKAPALPDSPLTDTDLAAQADGESDETALLDQLLKPQQGQKGKSASLLSAGTEASDTKNDKQWKNTFVLNDPIANALRSQNLNARSLSFADIPASAGSSTTSLQADLPVGTLQAAGFNPGLRTEQAVAPQLQVHTPAGQRVWAEDVGSKLIWMVGRNESKAELMLTPPSLGKLGVSIHTNGDQTSAHFVAATPAAREALEQAMPRLREMLQQAGINLGQTDVSTQGEQQAKDDGGQTKTWSGNNDLFQDQEQTDAAHNVATQSRWISTGNGMVDIFA